MAATSLLKKNSHARDRPPYRGVRGLNSPGGNQEEDVQNKYHHPHTVTYYLKTCMVFSIENNTNYRYPKSRNNSCSRGLRSSDYYYLYRSSRALSYCIKQSLCANVI